MTAPAQAVDSGPYDAVLLAHARAPRHQGTLLHPDALAEGYNALCGDRITVMLALRQGRIAEYAFRAEACALVVAAASLLGECLIGRDAEEVEHLAARFDGLLAGAGGPPIECGGLNAFADLARFPARRKCARLPLATVRAALRGAAHASSEEA